MYKTARYFPLGRKTKEQILLIIIKGGRGLSLRIPDNRITGVLPVRVEWPMHF